MMKKEEKIQWLDGRYLRHKEEQARARSGGGPDDASVLRAGEEPLP